MEKSDLVGNCCEELSKKMALGKRSGRAVEHASEGLGLGLGFIRYTRSMSGKRIAISSNMEVNSAAAPIVKRQCGEEMTQGADKSLLEALPQDILVRILCGVGHDDLKQLFHVSKLIREATLIAKQWFFAYSTPKKTSALRSPIHLGDPMEIEEVEAPNAPKQFRTNRSRLTREKLEDLSVALFASPEEGRWPRKNLFMEMETDN